MNKPLRDGINAVVMDYMQGTIAGGEPIDVAEMAHEMAQSLVDMIMEQEKEHQAPLLASTIASLGTNICKGVAYSILWAKHTKAGQVLPAGPFDVIAVSGKRFRHATLWCAVKIGQLRGAFEAPDIAFYLLPLRQSSARS